MKKALSLATVIRNVAKLEHYHFDLMMAERTPLPPSLVAPPRGTVVAIDLETTDPTLLTKGSAWAFPGVGKVIGVSVAWPGFNAYYPIAHNEGNVDARPVWAWLCYIWKREDLTFVFANAAYDLGWLQRELPLHDPTVSGYPLGMCCDVQFMAALIDENRIHRNMKEVEDDDTGEVATVYREGPPSGYSLDSLAYSMLGKRKQFDLLKAIEKETGLTHKALMGMLEKIPGYQLSPYGAADSQLTLELYHHMLPILRGEGLLDVHELESNLIPVSVKMRQRGIRVDLEATNRLIVDTRDNRIPEVIRKIFDLTGIKVAAWDNEALGEALRKGGVPAVAMSKTKKTERTEIRAPVLENLRAKHSIADLVLRLRKLAKIQTTFLEGHIIGHAIDHGDEYRIHANFNQLRAEQEGFSGLGGGTVTGRYSHSDPNLAQLPMRDDEFAKAIRGAFLPDKGKKMGSADYSGQEVRLMAHFAFVNKLPGGKEIHDAYHKDPRLDLHSYCAEVCNMRKPDGKLDRYPAKTMNFRIAYGAGGAAVAKALGLPTIWKRIVIRENERDIWEEIDDPTLAKAERREIARTKDKTRAVVELAGPEAAALLKTWREGMPFINELSKACKKYAQECGYLVALGGRRVRLERDSDQDYTLGVVKYLNPHKAMNKLIQSSAAQQTKMAMLAIEREGFNLQLQIHDELALSVESQKDIDNVAKIMQNIVELSVPVVVDGKIGDSLGDIEK